ncbi:uncharacterized protein NECHADRAFT_88455 [Fusarium vanettenii 77-13-4]|uniref:Uncharacterized protein n=1 Tax=Fusarium vanettenii (strain ATCC MYA-4622 / CBS 123669 / FGSC 9596 / NRRL 45880 / 77-13-4) TaxID=660122 RepID=C7ZBK2_FUSV7|nr:uncharacterized protein NECHADRAFT_88455 [Fusarium vanettenii 77-13-4]EEU38542.1 predicted protein [Fusarium vanettenii 77-13-4]
MAALKEPFSRVVADTSRGFIPGGNGTPTIWPRDLMFCRLPVVWRVLGRAPWYRSSKRAGLYCGFPNPSGPARFDLHPAFYLTRQKLDERKYAGLSRRGKPEKLDLAEEENRAGICWWGEEVSTLRIESKSERRVKQEETKRKGEKK